MTGRDPEAREGRDDDPRRAEDHQRVAEARRRVIAGRHVASLKPFCRFSRRRNGGRG